MNKETFKYKVIEAKDNPEESLILQTGLTSKFTIKDIKDEIVIYNKKKQEIEAKKKLSEAIIENIKENNPEIIKTIEGLEVRTIKAIFIYEKAMIEINASEEALKLYNESVEKNGKELEEIIKQTGLEMKADKPE